MNKNVTMKKTVKYDQTLSDAMNDDNHRAAPHDRDAPPLTEADLRRMRKTPQAKIIRRALGLSQEEFAARYKIPIGTLRDWEQGRCEPDQAAKSYLTVIAREPDIVLKALAPT